MPFIPSVYLHVSLTSSILAVFALSINFCSGQLNTRVVDNQHWLGEQPIMTQNGSYRSVAYFVNWVSKRGFSTSLSVPFIN